MKFKIHIRLFIIATLIWGAFWLLGYPDYYQQYSFSLMITFSSLLLIPIWFIAISILKRLANRNRLSFSLWLAFYFTVPLSIYDYIYCGIFLRHGLRFLLSYWYLTLYYFIPWLLLPLAAYYVNNKGHITSGSTRTRLRRAG